MTSNRDVAFVRHVLNRIAGIEIYMREHAFEGDPLVIVLKRGRATNKATSIEFRSSASGQVFVSFMKRDEPVSEHPEVFFDGLARLLYEQAGLIVGESPKPKGSLGYRKSYW